MMTDFQKSLYKFFVSKDDILCVQGNCKFFDTQCFFVNNSKKFCIDHLIYKKPFPINKIPVLIYSYDSIINNIIIQEWIKQSKKIILYSPFISEHIVPSLYSFTKHIISYIHYPPFPINVSYHESYRHFEDIYLFLQGFLLTSNTHYYQTIVFLKTPNMCDLMCARFKDTYSSISLHGRNLKSQFNSKEIMNVSLIFTTNLHKKPKYITKVRWILDFSDDSQIQMDERTTLANDNMSCDIHYFCSKDVLNVYPPPYPFDWKPFILHGILANNTESIKNWTSMYELEIDILRNDYKILEQFIGKYSNILSILLHDCPFLIEHYGQIIHLYHMTKCCSIPEIMVLLTSMSLSVIDVLKKYGSDSFFSVPFLKDVSSSSVLSVWKMILHEFSEDKETNLMILLNVIVSVIIKNSKSLFHINSTIWLRFMERWKYLCSLLGVFKFNNNKTIVFHKTVRGIFKKHFTGQLFNIENDNVYISNNYIVRHLIPPGGGTLYRISYPYNEKLFEYMWKLSDYSNWNSDIHTYARRWYRKSNVALEFDKSRDITMPLPLTVQNYIVNLQENIKNYYINLQSIMKDKHKHRTTFTETVITQIKEDVANRPYMVNYIETMRNFYKMLHKPEEDFNERISYFQYIDNQYKNGNRQLITNYEEYCNLKCLKE